MMENRKPAARGRGGLPKIVRLAAERDEDTSAALDEQCSEVRELRVSLTVVGDEIRVDVRVYRPASPEGMAFATSDSVSLNPDMVSATIEALVRAQAMLADLGAIEGLG